MNIDLTQLNQTQLTPIVLLILSELLPYVTDRKVHSVLHVFELILQRYSNSPVLRTPSIDPPHDVDPSPSTQTVVSSDPSNPTLFSIHENARITRQKSQKSEQGEKSRSP